MVSYFIPAVFIIWCPTCTKFGQWEPFQGGVCVPLISSFHFSGTSLLSGTERDSRLFNSPCLSPRTSYFPMDPSFPLGENSVEEWRSGCEMCSFTLGVAAPRLSQWTECWNMNAYTQRCMFCICCIYWEWRDRTNTSNSNFTPLYYSTLGSDTSNQTITSSMNTSCSLHWNWGQPTLCSPTPTLTLSLAWLHLIALELDCLEKEGRQWERGEVARVLTHVWLFVTPWAIKPTRLLCPWNFPGKNTGLSCHLLLQGSSWPRGWTLISWVSWIGTRILYHCATWEAPEGEPNINLNSQTASEHLFCPKVTCRGILGKRVLHSYEVLISLKPLVSFRFHFLSFIVMKFTLSRPMNILNTSIILYINSWDTQDYIYSCVCVSHSVVSDSLWPHGL